MTEKPWNAPMHPAEFFKDDFLQPLDMTEAQAAEALQIPVEALSAFLREEAPVTGDLALRLSGAFGCRPDYWLALQSRFELDTARARGVPTLARVPGLSAAA